jgi:hypothetical protein
MTSKIEVDKKQIDKFRKKEITSSELYNNSEPETFLSEDSQNSALLPEDKNLNLENVTSGYLTNEQGTFLPASAFVKILPAGYYEVLESRGAAVEFLNIELEASDLILFSNSIAEEILLELGKFWKLGSAYKAWGESHKRGILIYGGDGSGKNSTMKIVMSNCIQKGYLVFDSSFVVSEGITRIRDIEGNRPILVIIEDIDRIIMDPVAEAKILDLLDGIGVINNVVFLATTAYPERLPTSLKNRPSRFDRVMHQDYPDEITRKKYLQLKSSLKGKELNTWVKDTNNWSFAHIKELIVSVIMLDTDYKVSIDRINKLRQEVATSEVAISSHNIGFKTKR